MKSFFQLREDMDAAVKAYLAKGGKIKKLAPGKAAGYHGKDDPGKDVKGMMDKGDTKAVGTRKKVKSMEAVKPTKAMHVFDNEKDARAKAKEIGGKYVKGTGKSAGKHAAIREKQVNELSPATKKSYINKAAADIDNRSYAQGVDDVKGQGNDYDGANNKRIGNRLKGIRRATKEVKESVASVAASAKGDHKAHMKAAKAHAIAAIKHMDQYKETNDPAHQKAARLHRKAEQSHEGTAKLHKTSNNGQTKMTRTSIANKATAAANAASEDV